eukprot:CAMPEP_0113692332 /NCGR_PEP_ID=MMETSP0038_2-20120614/19020_1 /TAXON_ID=2898 /ORGANISM="Cryptomonas paramecium" /LENGTH=311 /DNA_ID=CAMNT_0000614221 /DNA_START=219 /DNA_END=1151 /DNA_ORIENTATION=+ /assembly_acc=CAM_ASM_000170
MTVRNRVEVLSDENAAFLFRMMRRRPQGTALLTVANHTSSLDDPGLLGAIMPWDIIFNPWRLRWALATQEICFPATNPKVQAFMGAGKVLPVKRGAGIDHGFWLDAARVVASGQWVHVFPEARVVQSGRLNLDPITSRSPAELRAKGRLKWGAAKLAAHAPVPPIIVPIYHVGMAGVLPQKNVWKTAEDGRRFFDNFVVPGGWNIMGIQGHKVRVRVGPAVVYDDLLREHEARHGPLRKVSAAPIHETWEQEVERWKSSEAERALYSAIMRRVEESLLALEALCEADLKARPDPDLKPFCDRSRAACLDPA